MKNLTIFTVPRYFKSPFVTIQYNAIRSWLILKPTPEVILCGNEEGVSEVAAKLGVTHIPGVKLSNKGTPLVNSVFNEVQRIAKNTVLSYVNTDIILTNGFLDALDIITSVLYHKFMVVGQRWDLDVADYIDFSNSSWEGKLRKEVAKHGKLHPQCGIDYHIFEKGVGMNMPPFIVGRPGWDNWFVSQALRTGLTVIDATKKVFVVHQNHDYSHIGTFEDSRYGEEAVINRKLISGKAASIRNANLKFQNNVLVKN